METVEVVVIDFFVHLPMMVESVFVAIWSGACTVVGWF